MKTVYLITFLGLILLHIEEIEALNFIAVGDFSCNKESIKTLKDIISQVKQTKIDFVILLGDIDYFGSINCVLSYVDQIKPYSHVLYIRGNHENEAGNAWERAAAYFGLNDTGLWTAKAADVLFIGMNSMDDWKEGSEQYKFVKVAINQDARWKFVLVHAPMLDGACSIKDIHARTMCHAFETYQPLFLSANITCVLQGHIHTFAMYSRGPICYPIIGNGGAEPYQDLEYPRNIYSSSAHGFALFQLSTNLTMSLHSSNSEKAIKSWIIR